MFMWTSQYSVIDSMPIKGPILFVIVQRLSDSKGFEAWGLKVQYSDGLLVQRFSTFQDSELEQRHTFVVSHIFVCEKLSARELGGTYPYTIGITDRLKSLAQFHILV